MISATVSRSLSVSWLGWLLAGRLWAGLALGGAGCQALRSTGRSARSVIDRPPRPTATIPDCTSSLMPNGCSTLISASSLSLLPVASTVTASMATSTTFARKRATVSSTRDRVSRSARTLTSRSSRWTAADGSSSTILSTLTSRLSCLVTCSSGRSSQFTTMVIREISSCSVGPTASESMLNPRRANSPATRTRRPALFSTSTDSVCLVISGFLFCEQSFCEHSFCGRGFCGQGGLAGGSLTECGGGWSFGRVPVRRHVPGHPDVVVAGAGGDHGPDHRVPVHHEVDHDRPVGDLHGFLDHLVHPVRALAAQPHAAVGLGQLDEVRHPGAALGALTLAGMQVGVRVALVVEQRLPLPHHAEVAVVDDGHLHRDSLQGAGGEFLVGHLEAAVTVDRPHARLRAAHLGSHR